MELTAARTHGSKRPRRLSPAIVVLAAVAGLSGCGVISDIPMDPDGTLDDVRGGELRVGVSEEPGLIQYAGGAASGPLADAVIEFADGIDARVVWKPGSEESLATGLEDGTLDLAVGGFTDQTPWTAHAAVTRGYPDLPGVEGRHVTMLVPAGENGLLSALETSLDAQVSGAGGGS